jgi:hypothetical protein
MRNRLKTDHDGCQAEFDFGPQVRTLGEFREILCREMGAPLDITLTRNRVNMISVTARRRGGYSLRLQEAFLGAPAEVLQALRAYLLHGRSEDWETVASFAQTINVPVAPGKPRVRSRGRHYDLQSLARGVNREFFNGRVDYHIGWSRAVRRRRRGRRTRSIRFGSWSPATRTIRIHPALDTPRVPERFVRYIIFHEMLHAVVQSVEGRGRRRDHPAEFAVLERRFPDLPGMRRLARQLLEEL